MPSEVVSGDTLSSGFMDPKDEIDVECPIAPLFGVVEYCPLFIHTPAKQNMSNKCPCLLTCGVVVSLWCSQTYSCEEDKPSGHMETHSCEEDKPSGHVQTCLTHTCGEAMPSGSTQTCRREQVTESTVVRGSLAFRIQTRRVLNATPIATCSSFGSSSLASQATT